MCAEHNSRRPGSGHQRRACPRVDTREPLRDREAEPCTWEQSYGYTVKQCQGQNRIGTPTSLPKACLEQGHAAYREQGKHNLSSSSGPPTSKDNTSTHSNHKVRIRTRQEPGAHRTGCVSALHWRSVSLLRMCPPALPASPTVTRAHKATLSRTTAARDDPCTCGCHPQRHPLRRPAPASFNPQSSKDSPR